MNNKEKVKHYYEHIVSNCLLEEFPEYIDENCAVRMGETLIPVGIDGMKQHVLDVRKTYPDLKMTITRQYVDGDMVITEFVMEGTHLGEWLGMKPTGKKLQMTGVDIDRLVDGKIIEHGGAVNTFDTLFEKGIIKPA